MVTVTWNDCEPNRPMVVSIVNKLYTYACRLLTDPKLFWILASLVVLADAILTELIIKFIPCQSPATFVAVFECHCCCTRRYRD